MKKTAVFLVFLLLFSMIVIADNEDEIIIDDENEDVSAGTTPDSPLWGLDVAMDKLKLAMTFSKAKRSERALKIAEERLEEVKQMIEENKFEQSEKARLRHEEFLEKLESQIEDDSDISVEEFEKDSELEVKLQKHKDKIVEFELRIKGNLTEDQQNKLDELIESMGNNVKKVEVKVRSRNEEAKIRIREELGEEKLAELVGELYERKAILEQKKARDAINRAEVKLERFESLKDKVMSGESIYLRRLSEAENEIRIATERIRNAIRDGRQIQLSNESLQEAKELLEQARQKIKDGDEQAAFELVEKAKNLAVKARMKYIDSSAEQDQEPANRMTGRVVDDSLDIVVYECQVDSDCEDGYYCDDGECDEEEYEEGFEDIETHEDEFELDENLLREFGLEIPQYETGVIESAYLYLDDAKDALEDSLDFFEAGEYKKAYAYAKYSRKLANRALSSKFFKLTEEEKEKLNENRENNGNDDEAECAEDADCEEGYYCDEDECEEIETEDEDIDDSDGEAECSEDADCEEGYYCDEDECEEIESGDEPGHNGNVTESLI